MVAFARRALVVIPTLLAGAGCKDDAIASLESTRDKVCECTDAACVNAAMDALADRPTKHQRKAEALAREITDCVVRVYQQTDAATEEEPEPEPEPGSGSASGSGSATDR